VTGSHRPYFVVNSERTEEDGGGAQALGGFEERIGTVGMIAVDQHRNRTLLPDCITDAFQPVDELRLETVQLHHQTQQRSDYLFARKNQNVTHSARPRRVVNTRQLADLRVLWRTADNP